ncbi:MAG: YraN family protein [Lachnospiraceae bacterium]|nr:YraN family protein [Lachnospiraceae bacterium]
MQNKINKRKIGQDKEKLACDFLKDKGFEILETNYRTVYEEIDIIAREENTLVFVEVKYRKSDKCGTPFESISIGKQRRISLGAVSYLKDKRLVPDNTSIRFDAIGITDKTILHIENAFEFNAAFIR